MVKKHPRHGFFNIDVLSFHRLAYRIFDECGYQPGEILEDLGVSMMLRKILSEGENNFLYFKKSIGNFVELYNRITISINFPSFRTDKAFSN